MTLFFPGTLIFSKQPTSLLCFCAECPTETGRPPLLSPTPSPEGSKEGAIFPKSTNMKGKKKKAATLGPLPLTWSINAADDKEMHTCLPTNKNSGRMCLSWWDSKEAFLQFSINHNWSNSNDSNPRESPIVDLRIYSGFPGCHTDSMKWLFSLMQSENCHWVINSFLG